jgi:hypothetical protein
MKVNVIIIFLVFFGINLHAHSLSGHKVNLCDDRCLLHGKKSQENNPAKWYKTTSETIIEEDAMESDRRGQSLGKIQPNNNAALPSSYNFQEYVFAEPADQGACQGISNNTATIQEVFMAQTHRHEIGHPLFFTIGHRPVLLQVAVTGTGTSPDVQVEGILNGNTWVRFAYQGLRPSAIP